MAWIEPLQLETWLINVVSGSDTNYFAILALLVITSMAAYFRMNGITTGLMIGLFLLLFSSYIPPTFTFLITVLAGLMIGYWISKIVK